MGKSFKEQAAQQRAAIPQVDPQSTGVPIPAPLPTTERKSIEAAAPHEPKAKSSASTAPQTQPPASKLPIELTIVDTSEAPVNRGFFMYPSRHRQITKDLVYVEGRKPWQIIEDAVEEYVVRHYGKEYKRK
jgi:hypothetical protein